MKKKKEIPGPYAAPTKDQRFAGTFEVLIPVPDRVRPHRVPLQFETQAKAESWLHSAEGKETIADILEREKD
jgi:hypothetical protein